MKSLITLVLILVIFSNIKGGDYSIGSFLNYLQEKGIYDILVEIKKYLGSDICICFCKELMKNNKCEQVVNIYIIYNLRNLRPSDLVEKNIEFLNVIIENYYLVLLNAGFTSSEIERALKKTVNKISIYDIVFDLNITK